MSYEAHDGSHFYRDIRKLDEMIDYLECYLMYPERNPINKKDIIYMCHRIKNMADHIAKETLKSGYGYFRDVIDDDSI